MGMRPSTLRDIFQGKTTKKLTLTSCFSQDNETRNSVDCEKNSDKSLDGQRGGGIKQFLAVTLFPIGSDSKRGKKKKQPNRTGGKGTSDQARVQDAL